MINELYEDQNNIMLGIIFIVIPFVLSLSSTLLFDYLIKNRNHIEIGRFKDYSRGVEKSTWQKVKEYFDKPKKEKSTFEKLKDYFS